MEILIAIIAGFFSVLVAILGSVFIGSNNTKIQNRKLKEENYVKYIESLHNYVDNPDSLKAAEEYTLYRSKMFITANEKVVKAMLKYESVSNSMLKDEKHDEYLTAFVKSIRQDLGIKDKAYPQIQFRVTNKGKKTK